MSKELDVSYAGPGSGLYNVLQKNLATLARMWGKRSEGLLLLAGTILASSGCAPALQTNSAARLLPEVAAASDSSPQTTATMPRAGRLAYHLSEAETAYDSRESARLSQLVNALYASGIAPKDEGQTDTLGMWAAASGGEAKPFRGRLLGPAYVRGELAPGERWKSAQTFKSGEPSTLAVSHKGAGPISISVSDARERSVCKKGGRGVPACRFTPLYTQRYSIELVNEGQNSAVYFLVFD